MQANILLFGNNLVKLTDFGQSRSFDYPDSCLKTTAYDRDIGSFRWLAYELIVPPKGNNMDVKRTKQSDIWAFGMVLYVSCLDLHNI